MQKIIINVLIKVSALTYGMYYIAELRNQSVNLQMVLTLSLIAMLLFTIPLSLTEFSIPLFIDINIFILTILCTKLHPIPIELLFTLITLITLKVVYMWIEYLQSESTIKYVSMEAL